MILISSLSDSYSTFIKIAYNMASTKRNLRILTTFTFWLHFELLNATEVAELETKLNFPSTFSPFLHEITSNCQEMGEMITCNHGE